MPSIHGALRHVSTSFLTSSVRHDASRVSASQGGPAGYQPARVGQQVSASHDASSVYPVYVYIHRLQGLVMMGLHRHFNVFFDVQMGCLPAPVQIAPSERHPVLVIHPCCIPASTDHSSSISDQNADMPLAGHGGAGRIGRRGQWGCTGEEWNVARWTL